MNDGATSDVVTMLTNHFANVIYFDLGRYLIAAGFMTALLLIFRGWAGRRKIQERKAARQDYAREVLSSLRTVLVFAVTTLLTLAGRELGVIELKLEAFTLFTLIWQTVLMVLVHDAYFYWMHRAIHHKKLFRATHLHHHKSRTPTPWAAYSFSSAEAALEAVFVPLFLLTTSLFGIAYAGFAIFLFLWHMILRNVIGHAGHEIYPAGWVDNRFFSWWNTTTHHDLHHSEGRHNFGLYFTWWDKWMGTEHPRYKEEFRANALPIRLPFPLRIFRESKGTGSKLARIPGSSAEKASVITMALFSAAVTLGGPLSAVELGAF
ncbi:MAG: sterol desaturase family protein [Erythrobacter sp.]